MINNILLLILFILFLFILCIYTELFTEINDYSDYTIICARYNKDISFLKKININSVVIQKCIEEVCDYNITCPNKGNEASSYLYYIIKNWNNLPKNLIFIHDEDESWHHNGKISQNIKEWINEYKNNGSKYYEFNSVNLDPEFIHDNHPNNQVSFQKYYSDNLEKYIGKWTDLPLKPRKCCAQFIVSKKQIKKHPLEMYQNLYNWIISDKYDIEMEHDRGESYVKGLYCEFTWNFIFN